MTEEETKYTEYDFEGIETVEEYFDRFWNNREALEHLVNLFLIRYMTFKSLLVTKVLKKKNFQIGKRKRCKDTITDGRL